MLPLTYKYKLKLTKQQAKQIDHDLDSVSSSLEYV